MKPLSANVLALFLCLAPWTYSAARAAEETLQPESPPVAASPAPYTLPWQLRPIMAVNVLRLDSAIAQYSDPSGNREGLAAASVITGAYRVIPNLAVLARFGMLSNGPPAGNPSAHAFLNPLLGAVYSLKLDESFRMAFFFGMTVPVGTGGGNFPSAAARLAHSTGILARSAMDNALFGPNYLTLIPGVSLAYIAHDLTLQLEATVLQLNRVRGERVDADAFRTNFTSGLAAGYTFTPTIAAVGELRYQRWISNPSVSTAASPAVDNLSFAIGPRITIKAGGITLRPGIAYAQGLIGAIAKSGFTSPTHSDHILFLDLPIFF